MVAGVFAVSLLAYQVVLCNITTPDWRKNSVESIKQHSKLLYSCINRNKIPFKCSISLKEFAPNLKSASDLQGWTPLHQIPVYAT